MGESQMTKMMEEILQQPKVLAKIEEKNKDTLMALAKEINDKKIALDGKRIK